MRYSMKYRNINGTCFLNPGIYLSVYKIDFIIIIFFNDQFPFEKVRMRIVIYFTLK